MRVSGIFVLATFFVVIAIAPIAIADNVTTSTTPFVTIDPIGNHTIGDVFFINGTTNLPATQNLTMDIFLSEKFFRSPEDLPHASSSIVEFPISPGSSGINYWSVNVTDYFKNLTYGQYLIMVYSSVHFPCNTNGCGVPKAYADSNFTLSQTNDSTTSTVLQTTITSTSSIQSATSEVTRLPTTPHSPLPVALPIAAFAGIILICSRYKK
jgi:hypothetical protein